MTDWFTKEVVGGYERVCAELEAPVRNYLGQRFLAGSWYDYLPLFLLYRKASELTGIPLASLERTLGRNAAARDLRGIYKLLLMVASVQQALGRLPAAWRQYFNFGDACVSERQSKSGEFAVTGFPSVFAEDFLNVLDGWITCVLENAGGMLVTPERRPIVSDGETHGVPTTTIAFFFRWR